MERGAKGKGTESGKYEGERVRKDKVERSGERSRGQEKNEEEKYIYNNLTYYYQIHITCRCHIRIYSGTSLIWAPLGPK